MTGRTCARGQCGECVGCDIAEDIRAGLDPYCGQCGRAGGPGDGGPCMVCREQDSIDVTAHETAHAAGAL